MKNTITRGYTVFVTLFITLFLSLAVSGCCKPTPPEPNPDGGKNTDTIPNNGGGNGGGNEDPQKTPFKEWLQFDAESNLSEVPIPFADFDKGTPDDAKAWEKSYGSTLYKEQTEKGMTFLFYNTNDPKKLNTKRFYTFKEGRLVNAVYSIASKLIFESTLSQLTPNDAFEAVLLKEGYSKVEKGKEGQMFYSNNKYLVAFSYNAKDKNVAIGMVFPMTKELGEYKFHKDVRDFPLLAKKTWIKDYKEADIKAHEKSVGRFYSEKQSKKGETMTFIADATVKTNFQIVKYDRKDGNDSKGNPRKAQIVATSLCITNVEMLRTPEVEAYLKDQGFVYSKEISSGGKKILIYNANELGINLTVAELGKGSTMWVFDKYAIKGGDDPQPQEKRQPYYLPLYMWDAPITEDSPIIAAEKARGMEKVTYRPGETTGDFPRPAEITAEPKFDLDYSSASLKKLGISSITYTVNKFAVHPEKNVQASWLLNYMGNKKKEDEGLKGAVAFLEENGFVKNGGSIEPGKVGTYYNATEKVLVTISRLWGCTITFEYREQN